MRVSLGRLAVLSGTLFNVALPADAAAQQDPSPGGAWSACQEWVRKSLWEPEGLRFPAPAPDRLKIAVGESPVGKPRYTVRSYAILTGSESEEVIPFTCTIDYRSGPGAGDGYVFRRLTLPDTTVAVPGERREGRVESDHGRGRE